MTAQKGEMLRWKNLGQQPFLLYLSKEDPESRILEIIEQDLRRLEQLQHW
jgi:hypothetical protein